MAKTAYAPEELTREAYKLLAREKARVGGLNYAPYKGASVSPMSSLTERARTLQEQFAAKPAPYSGKIQSVLSRDNQGITPANVQELLGQIQGAQRGFSQGPILDKLRDEFRSAIEPRIGGFTGRIEGDIGRYLPEAQGTLENLARVSGSLESSRNRQTASTFQDLQAGKQAQREALLKNLEQFGAQKQAYNNMGIGANKAQFDREANEPYRKLQLLEQALRTTGVNPDEPLHPDLAKSQTEQIAQALRAYGVDPSKPASQWDTTRTQPARYTGQLVAGLPAEIQASGNILGRLDPSLKDSYTDQRKALTRGLLDNPSLSASALGKLNPAMAGKVSMLEQSAAERMQKDLEALGNQYIRLGQYRSPQHLKAAEERAAELNKAVLEQRNKIMQESLRDQLALGHEEEIDKIKQLGQIGAQSQKDYGDLLKTIRDTNKLGAEKFANNQAENEELYKNYQNENLWQWPHMRAAARNEGMQAGIGEGRSGALGEVFRGLSDRNISLDNLAALNTRYSEIERERDRYQQELLGAQEGLRAAQASGQGLQEQLARYQQAEEAQRTAQEQARIRSEQQAREEMQRQLETQRQAEAAEAQRRQAQEAERLRQLALEQQRMEQSRAAEAEKVRQEQVRAEQARIAEQQRQAQIEQDNILKAKQQALREFAGLKGGRMGKVEELQINNLLKQYFPPTDYRHWVLPAYSSGSSFKEAMARAQWNQMMDNRSRWIAAAQKGFPGGVLKLLK